MPGQAGNRETLQPLIYSGSLNHVPDLFVKAIDGACVSMFRVRGMSLELGSGREARADRLNAVLRAAASPAAATNK